MMVEHSYYLIKNGTLSTPFKILPQRDILIQDSLIKKIGEHISPEGKKPGQLKVIDAKGLYVSPGLIDSHTHGGNGFDFMAATDDQIQQLLLWYAKNGVTSILPTLSFVSAEEYLKSCAYLEKVLKQGELGAKILGIHIEGPYISLEKKGAQPIVEGGLPKVAEFEDLINHYKGLVKIVTLAPEIPNGLQLVDALVRDGIIPSIGHSNATFEEAEEAIRHGVTRSSHTYNGMSGLNHRKPGVVGAVMDSDVVYAEITLDGFHVHPGAAQALFRAKGIDRMILITDSMQAAGLGDGEFIRPGNRKIIVKDGMATLLTGNLAGSVLTLNKAVRNARNFLHISLPQALQMASANVAKSIGAQNLGEIKEGSKADLIIHDEDMNVLYTMIDGRSVFSKLGLDQINGH